MAKLYAVLIAYNEADLLPQCLASVYGKVDEIVLVEGRIAAFPGESPHSTDDTMSIANTFGCHIISNRVAWEDECEMRSAYLIGNDGDVYFHIDADERLMTELPYPAELPGNVYKVAVKMVGAPVIQYRPRWFRHTGHMQYRGVHDALFSDGELISRPEDVPTLHSVWLAHYQITRNKIRRQGKQQYYRVGYAHEGAIRQDWNMYNVKG